MKKILARIVDKSVKLNHKNIMELLDRNPFAKLLDLGCDEGTWTLELAKKIGTKQIYGIEIVEERAKIARKKQINVKIANLNKKFPFEDNYFDVIHANQVIEHVPNIDHFVSEIYRVLKPQGYVIVSTENASSWHNIFASIMGWQIFSLTNITSKKMGVGNPLAIHRGNKIDLSTWTHKTIFNYLGLKELFEAYNFKNIKIKGAGYYPLPPIFGKVDVRHSHFITLKADKK